MGVVSARLVTVRIRRRPSRCAVTPIRAITSDLHTTGRAQISASCTHASDGHRLEPRSPCARPQARTVTNRTGPTPWWVTPGSPTHEDPGIGHHPRQDEEVVEMTDVRRLPGPNADLWDW